MKGGWLEITLALGFLFIASRVEAISIDFTQQSHTVFVGAEVPVGITVSGLGHLAPPSIGTFDLNIAFDPSRLAFAGGTFGDPVLGDELDLSHVGSIRNLTVNPGVVNIFELSLDAPQTLNSSQPGTFTLATLNFTPITVGDSVLTTSINALGDASGASLIATTGMTTIHAIIPEPSTVILLLVGIVGMALSRQRNKVSSLIEDRSSA